MSKLSYKIKFDEYVADARFDGLKRINLHAASGDATRLHEYLGYATYRDFGIDAPRTVPARVFINGELQGVFIAVEEVDGRYTRAHYPDGPNGNLYKEIWPNPGTADRDFIDALETNEDAGDISGIQEFAAAIAGSNTATFVERMEPWVDLEHVLRYMAVDRAIKNWDGITAFYLPNSPHNFFLVPRRRGGGPLPPHPVGPRQRVLGVRSVHVPGAVGHGRSATGLEHAAARLQPARGLGSDPGHARYTAALRSVPGPARGDFVAALRRTRDC